MSKASDLARLMTSGSTAVHGEAGVTSSGSTGLTTNLQQGLCKHWITLDGSGTVTVLDSFNNTSITDTAAARYTTSITNDFSNANYSVSGLGQLDTSVDFFFACLSDANPPTTSGFEIMLCGSGGSQADVDRISTSSDGDLA